jgi:hypothetical protein
MAYSSSKPCNVDPLILAKAACQSVTCTRPPSYELPRIAVGTNLVLLE